MNSEEEPEIHLHTRALIKAYQDRLKVLELQAARFGALFVPPHVIVEINELRQDILNLEQNLPCLRREREQKYLHSVVEAHQNWRRLYVELAVTARVEQSGLQVIPEAEDELEELRLLFFQKSQHEFNDDQVQNVASETYDSLGTHLKQHRRVALIGDPGAGKTTTLKRLALDMAEAALDMEDIPLPLFVPLGIYKGGDFTRFLATHFGNLPLHLYLQNRVMLLLDGLNEMSSDHVPQVISWLRQHPHASVLVSCRRLDYIGLQLPLQRIDIAPLDVRRIFNFIRKRTAKKQDGEKLFWALSGAQTRSAWEWLRRQQQNATFDDFWFGRTGQTQAWELEKGHMKAVQDALREHKRLPGMLGVVSNPFLLTAVIASADTQGNPPANRGQLFEKFVALLMEKRGRPAAMHRPPWIDTAIQRQALARLAYRMQIERIGTNAPVAWTLETLSGTLPYAEQLLYLAVSAGILEQGQTVRFTHQLLQEYFAAYEMGENLQHGIPATYYWPRESWWEQTGWEETAILLAGLTNDATTVVCWLTPVHPTLAYRCATESGARCDSEVLKALFEPGPGARVSPIARAAWGREIAERDDTRPGVKLRPDGIPDLVWCKMPTNALTWGFGKKHILPACAIAKYPVTVAQFQAFIDMPDGYANESWWVGLARRETKAAFPAFNYANHPRENVNWYVSGLTTSWARS